MKNLYVRLSANVGEFRQQMAMAGASTRQFGNDMSAAAAKSRADFDRLGKGAMIAGGLVVAGLGAAVVSAARFEQAMRNTNSIMHQSEAEFRATSQAVLDMSRRVPQSATTLANGLYDVASSGFHGAEGMKVLEASAVAATAGMTDTATAARAISGVLNAYGMSAEEAGEISDVLFQTVNVGVVTFEELAQNVGDFISTSAALGITVEETGAALATMTLAGITAAEASTALNRVMSSFIKPSDAMKEALASLGYESGTAAIEALGLKGAVEAIDQVAGGSVESIANMYGEVRAIKGALALGAAEGRNYASSTKAMEEASDGAGAAMEAYKEQSKAFNTQLQQAKNSIGAVAIEVGSTFLPAMTEGAQAIGGLADFVGDLPGPLRTVASVGAGVAGMITLTGGAALIAVPKLVAYRAAVDTLSNSSPAAAKGLGKLNTALSLGAKAVGIGAVLLTVKSAVDALRESMADGTPGADDMARDLELLATKGAASGAIIEQFGADLDGLAVAMERAGKAGNDVAKGARGPWETLTDFLDGDEGKFQTGKKQLEELNEAFTQLFDSDPEAATKAWQELVEQWEAGGRDVADLVTALPAVSEGLDANADASAQAQAEMAALTEEAAALGINLNATSDLAEMSAEDMVKLRDSVDPVIFAMVEMGTVTKEQAEAAQQALESFVDGVESAFAEVLSPVSLYTSALDDMNETAEKAWTDAGKSTDDFVGKAGLSLVEFVGAMQSSAEEVRTFTEDIGRAIEMGYDPALIAQLLQAGPEQAGPILQTLLSDHTGQMVGMVNDTVDALEAVNTRLVEIARLTYLATTATTDEMVADLGTAMAIAETKARLGAGATAKAIADELNLGLDDVRRVVGEYGIVLASLPTRTYAPARNPDRGRVPNADGNVYEGAHVAQIAAAGAMRLWAEPETGGEAYIPLAPSKRNRSLRIWQETGRRLGVLGFAAGGITDEQRAAQQARDRARTVTDNAFALGGVATGDYLAELDARMAAEEKFTSEWMTHYQRREQVVRDFADGLNAVYDDLAQQQDVQFREERLSTTEYLEILRDRHARAVDLTGYWGQEAFQLREEIRAQEEQQLQRALDAEDIMYEEGRLSGDEYITALKRRHDAIVEQYGYWSREAHQVREEIRGVQDDMTADAEDAAAAIEDALGRVQSQLADMYERAMDRFRQQQEEHARAIEQARNRVVSELAGVYASAQQRFDAQSDEMERAVAERNARLADRIEEFRQSIAKPVRDVGDLIATFGRRTGESVAGDEVLAMLEHRIEAAHRWDDALRDLQSGGLNDDLVTRLAQAGPAALGLAEALTSLNPDVVNDAMAQLEAMGGSLADVFVQQEEAGLAAEVAAETPLPVMQAFNDLLNEELELWKADNAERTIAQQWAEGMASSYMPAVNFQWRTFDDLLNEEIEKQRDAAVQRKEAEQWARSMTTSTRNLNDALREMIALLREQAEAGAAATSGSSSGSRPRTTTAPPPLAPSKYDRTVYSYDSGGYLPTGLSMAYNGTGRPEPVGHHLGGVVVQSGAVQQTIHAAPGTDTAAVRQAARDGAAEGLAAVLAGVDRGAR